MSNELTTQNTATAIASSAENMAVIVKSAPGSYRDNRLSHDKCLSACGKLLDEIKEKGMSDALDQQAALFIGRSKNTVKVMNERRAPVTKLFDRIRTEYTLLENEIDPSKAGTIPYQLQQYRNAYAAKKREEEEARRRAEEVLQAAIQARQTYTSECNANFKVRFNEFLVGRINALTELENKTTLESYQAVYDTVTGFDTEMPVDWNPVSAVRIPLNLSPEEARQIRAEVLQGLMPQFREQFGTEVGDYRQDILDRMPSKKKELERIAEASEEEAKKLAEQIKAREAAERARKEQERIAKEQEEAKKAEMSKSASIATSLFDQASLSTPAYQPKAKVTKKIKITSPNAIMPILSMWWSKEGSALSMDELAKIFKKQISFCEKLANKEGEFITGCPSIEYVGEVKAQ